MNSGTSYPFTIIVTVGPTVFDPETIRMIQDRTEAIFRLNGAHLSSDEIGKTLRLLKASNPDIKTMVDLPGVKIRTAHFEKPIVFRCGETFELERHKVSHPEALKGLGVGETVCANDALLHFTVVGVSAGSISLKPHSDGVLENNKGLHGRGIEYEGEYLSDLDRQLMDVAVREGANFLGLSYIRNLDDIRMVEERLHQLDSTTQCIFKIETRSALSNLSSILDKVQCVLVDRGDLASEIGIMSVPVAQRKIVSSALSVGCRVFCATQFLQSMVSNPTPLIAEVDSIFSAVSSGVHGIQLSAETAIGKHGLDCIDLILETVKTWQSSKENGDSIFMACDH